MIDELRTKYYVHQRAFGGWQKFINYMGFISFGFIFNFLLPYNLTIAAFYFFKITWPGLFFVSYAVLAIFPCVIGLVCDWKRIMGLLAISILIFVFNYELYEASGWLIAYMIKYNLRPYPVSLAKELDSLRMDIFLSPFAVFSLMGGFSVVPLFGTNYMLDKAKSSLEKKAAVGVVTSQQREVADIIDSLQRKTRW